MRKVFITGGRRGIGLAIAEKLKAQGHEIIAPSREDFDLSDPAAVAAYLKAHPGLTADILINNAGENKISPISDLSFEDWLRIQNVNMNSVFLISQFFGPKMQAAKSGHILNISSAYSFLARPGRAAYGASKGALNSFTRTCALEWGPSNVLVNSLSPGFVDTDLTRKNNTPEMIQALENQTALKRLAKTEEIAELAAFLVSEKNTYITGQNIVIDGGFSIQ